MKSERILKQGLAGKKHPSAFFQRWGLGLILGLAAMSLFCSKEVLNLRQDKTRSALVTFEDDRGQKGEILFFPRTYAGGDTYSMIITAPVAFDDSLLYSSAHDSFVNWFTLRGVNVWLVRYPAGMSYADYGRLHLKSAIEKIRKVSKSDRWVVGGMSLGGIAVMEYLMQNSYVGSNTTDVDKVFFLGSGFDYSYPSSLAYKATHFTAENYCEQNTELCIGLFGALPGVAVSAEAVRRLKSESISAAANADRLGSIRVPAIFVNGKIDNLCPSETVFPVFEKYGRSGSRELPRFYQPSEPNFYSRDFNHLDLFTHKQAFSKLYPELNRYLVE